MKAVIELYKNVVVQIATPYSTGTGFYLRDYQLIVTNDHVVRDNREVVVDGAAASTRMGVTPARVSRSTSVPTLQATAVMARVSHGAPLRAEERQLSSAPGVSGARMSEMLCTQIGSSGFGGIVVSSVDSGRGRDVARAADDARGPHQRRIFCRGGAGCLRSVVR